MSERIANIFDSAVGGDRDALSALLRRHGPAVRAIMAPEMPRRWRAVLSLDDVMQETYADAFLGITKFEGRDERTFVSWLVMIARRNLHDAIDMLEACRRGRQWRQVQPAQDAGSSVGLLELLGVTTTTPSRHAARDEACGALQDAISKLHETYRQVVQMYDLSQQPVEQVATALGRSAGAVYMLRARAHRMLRDILGRSSNFWFSA